MKNTSLATPRSTTNEPSALAPMRERSASSTVGREKPLFGRLVGGRYRVRSFVGDGVTGETYLARQTSQERNVIVKSVRPSLAAATGFSDAFYRELNAASAFASPSFTKVLSFGGEPDGLLYVAREHADGKSLAEVIASEGPLSEERIVALLEPVVRALGVAHAKGLSHRGISPFNVFVVPAADGKPERALVTDLGLSGLASLDGAAVASPYAAPEVAGGKADKRADVYSLGVVIYEMLTGVYPEGAGRVAAPPHATEQAPSCSKRLADVAMRAMQHAPAARYPSARTMLDAMMDRSPFFDRTTAMPAQEDDADDDADGMRVTSELRPVHVAAAKAPEVRAVAKIAPSAKMEAAKPVAPSAKVAAAKKVVAVTPAEVEAAVALSGQPTPKKEAAAKEIAAPSPAPVARSIFSTGVAEAAPEARVAPPPSSRSKLARGADVGEISGDLDRTVLDLAAMPEDDEPSPQHTVKMAALVDPETPPPSSVPAVIEPATTALGLYTPPVAFQPIAPERVPALVTRGRNKKARDLVPLLQGLAVFVGFSIVGVLVLVVVMN